MKLSPKAVLAIVSLVIVFGFIFGSVIWVGGLEGVLAILAALVLSGIIVWAIHALVMEIP